MATITTPTFLDGGVARTAGETFTMNGGVLTIRTDTRWHANAPAGMLGSIGSTTISATLGGGVIIDGSDVRWMAYDSGAGVVPAIGTTITQGGVSGYLLGVWSALNSAPTAVGAAMPTTGFLKFREVTGGSFAIGALTGITANATEADRAGWIEVVQDQAAANTVPRLGYFRTRGDWFYLDNTTGVAGQQIQVPTNGGGAGTRVPCIWIETGVGTNVFEKFSCTTSTYFITANLSTDLRCKFAFDAGNGIVRIGGDGTNAIGFLPPAGCRVRIPNVLGRQTSAANRALNLVPHATLATRPDFTTTSAGEIDFEYFMNDWYHLFTAPYKVRLVHCATMDIHTTSNEASPTELDDYATGAYQAGIVSFTATNNPLGGVVKDCRFFRPDAASNGHSWSMTGCSNYDFQGNVETGVIAYARSTGVISFSQCRNFTQSGDFICYQETWTPSTCSNFEFDKVTYIDRFTGVTNATTGKYAIATTVSCDNINVYNVSFGTVLDNAPYLGVYNSSNCSNITIRNGGTPAAPLDVNSAAAPAYIFADSGNNDGVRVQNINLNATRTGIYTSANTSKNLTFENLRGTVGAQETASVNTLAKGIRAASYSTTGQASVYGSHWFDMFTSDTAGNVWLAFNEPTAFSADQYEAVSLGTGAGFTSGGQIVMPNVGDQIIFTMPYYCLGHTALANVAPTLTGTNTGNFTYEYDIDTGTGFTGSYKTLNATNLSGETISPSTGFKLKFRITTATANAGNALTYIRITTVSTLVAQTGNLYPQDYTTITLNGMVAGSRVQLYDTTNNAELFNGVVAGTSLSYQTPYTADFTCRIRVMKQSGTTAYMWVEFSEPVTIDGVTRTITQELDTIYNSNAIDGSTVTGIIINDGALLVETDTGALSWGQIYAYETYWLMTEEGIRDESRFMEAVDNANYKLFDFNIKNVSSPSSPLVITGGYGVDGVTGNAIDVIDPTGGTIICAPDHVVPFETSGGGGGASAADIWSYSSRTLTSGSAPSASTVASAVRTELSTELGRIDVATSTRLASASYTAPDNASIAAILDDTGTSGVVLANNSITASVVATNALNNSSFTTGYFNSINAEVDTAIADANLSTFDHTTNTVISNVKYVNDIEVKGTGTDIDPWNPV